MKIIPKSDMVIDAVPRKAGEATIVADSLGAVLVKQGLATEETEKTAKSGK